MKIYNHIDVIQHNFLTFKKYKVNHNIFYTDEKYSLNRKDLNLKYKFNPSCLSINLKNMFLSNLTGIFPLRGEKRYIHYLQFKLIKLPYFEKEYTANEVIDIFLGYMFGKKYIR